MNIAIVEDSITDSQYLSEGIRYYCNQSHIGVQIKTYSSGENLLLEFEKGKYNIIFMDIYLEGMDGIKIAQKIREIDAECLLVFSTSSQLHAVQSFRVRAFDYLVKPYDYSQLNEVMRLCDIAINGQAHYIEIKNGRLWVKLRLYDIIYTDYYNHYIQIHTKTKLIKTHMLFSEFSKLLLCYKEFICCYRNCIINMDEVREIDEKDFVMKNGDRVPLARAQCKELRQKYADYVFEKMDGGI